MPTNRLWLNAVRPPEDVGVMYLRRTVSFDTPFADAPGVTPVNGVPIGALEAGCIPLGCDVTIETAFNAATTNTLDIGTAAAPAGLAAAASTLAGATGFKQNLAGTLSGIPLAANTIVYAKYAQTGAAATAGKAHIVLKFAVKREVEGVAWPAN
ncbi:hypothetical protein [Bradyrhizobium sp.]|uniref:hypothetical protein n=1 Tax=Bradyrhizobium sp. TaxID=376 RepID=UPI0025C3C646|nr:hypothetical protein [Bradyrhizobium sp.]